MAIPVVHFSGLLARDWSAHSTSHNSVASGGLMELWNHKLKSNCAFAGLW